MKWGKVGRETYVFIFYVTLDISAFRTLLDNFEKIIVGQQLFRIEYLPDK